jgi:rRNA maturation protein Nop10
MEPMTTLTEIIDKLRKEGYTTDFNLKETCLECGGSQLKIHPDEFKIDRHFRFEGDSNPDDEAIVYAISSDKHQMKGILVNGYGVSSDPLTDEMIKALQAK